MLAMTLSLTSSFSSSLHQNRRKIPRYGVGSLRAWIHKPGFLGLFDSRIELSPIDFNQTGMAFRHTHLLSPGQPVVVDLMKDNHKVASVVAIVRYTTQLSSHFRSGVEFDFNANEHMCSSGVRQVLSEMESMLKGVVILAEV